MMKLCIKTTTGVAIMTVIFPPKFAERENITLEELNAFADNEVARWSAANPGQYISHREIAESDIPPDRSKRHLWADITDSPGIDILPDPGPPIPSIVSPYQARAALADIGLLDDVEALMANPATPKKAKLAWTHAQEFRRDSPTVLAMSAQLGLTEEQLDALFIAAAQITA